MRNLADVAAELGATSDAEILRWVEAECVRPEGEGGGYRFRTLRPVAYPGRAPHIHVKVRGKNDQNLLTTQVYVKGHPQNARDGVLRGIRNPQQRASVLVPFVPVVGSKIGELSVRFDIVLGWTPEA